MSDKTTKGLRFANLVRVSTEKQEKKGESLATQRKYNARDVERMEGRIVETYGGQEHGTPGWEKAEVDRLIADAAKDKWDAVIVTYADRWSRDNAKSKEGLEALRKHGRRFFIGSAEQNLFDPTVRLNLGMQAEIGEYFALQGAKKSIENKIERAMKGFPSCGEIPYGRTFDKVTGEWGVDDGKLRMVQEVARLYLHGEDGKEVSLKQLLKRYPICKAFSQLYKILRECCGPVWIQQFDSNTLNIHERIETPVPALLDDETIRMIRQRMTDRRKHERKGGRRSADYLLGGRIFCGECGYQLTGQLDVRNASRVRIYRHAKEDRERPCCIRPRPHVRADGIEQKVVQQLFNLFGNPAAIERAVMASVPDSEKTIRRKEELEADLAKIANSRNRILDVVADGVLTKEQASKKLSELKERETAVREELDGIKATLESIPDERTLRCWVEKIGESIFVFDEEGYPVLGGNSISTFLAMDYEDKRKLIDAVFRHPLPDGTRAGVYVYPDPTSVPRSRNRKWLFKIRGRLDFELVVGCAARGTDDVVNSDQLRPTTNPAITAALRSTG